MLRRILRTGDSGVYVEFDIHGNERCKNAQTVIAINGNNALLSNYVTVTLVSYKIDELDEFAFDLANHTHLFLIDKNIDEELNIDPLSTEFDIQNLLNHV